MRTRSVRVVNSSVGAERGREGRRCGIPPFSGNERLKEVKVQFTLDRVRPCLCVCERERECVCVKET